MSHIEARLVQLRRQHHYLLAALSVCVGLLNLGCGQTVQQRVQELNRDGVGLLLKHDYAAAEVSFREALALSADDLTTQYNLAVLAHLRGQVSDAEYHYRRCLTQNPHFLPARRGLSQLMWEQNRLDELHQFVSQWAQDRPDLADAHALLGWYWAKRGDYPAAETAVQRALTLEPQHPFALAELGRLYEIYRYLERARSLYERSLFYDPWQPELRARLARLRFPERNAP